MKCIHIIYASTSGNTEYVVNVLMQHVGENATGVKVSMCRAESATLDDFNKGDCIILASGSWNTGGREGQVNLHMYDFLYNRAQNADLSGKECAVIGLGDHRYKYTARATEHMAHFIKSHGGHALTPPLVIVDEPYGQEKKVHAWVKQLVSSMQKL